jgi:hypothetical protein
MYSKRKKVVTWVILMAKQTGQHEMQEGYSKYGLCVDLSAEIHVSLQPKELYLFIHSFIYFHSVDPYKVKLNP